MLLYTDIISEDVLFSDTFPITEVDDIAYEVDCKVITIKEGDIDIGANSSAEGGDYEGIESTSKQVNNLAHAFRLNGTSFDKQSYIAYIQGNMKTVKTKLQETNPDRVAVFERKATPFVKKILANFKDYQFYTGGSMNADGMVALLNYREDGVTPYFTFFKNGLKVEEF